MSSQHDVIEVVIVGERNKKAPADGLEAPVGVMVWGFGLRLWISNYKSSSSARRLLPPSLKKTSLLCARKVPSNMWLHVNTKNLSEPVVRLYLQCIKKVKIYLTSKFSFFFTYFNKS
jgi:hypothetical protein